MSTDDEDCGSEEEMTDSGSEDLAPEVTSEMLEAQKDLYLGIFMELNQSQRFVEFVNNNFDIQQRVDEEKKTIEILVVEKPVMMGIKMQLPQIKKLYSACGAAGVVDTTKLVTQILDILGQETGVLYTADDTDFSSKPRLVT